MAYEPAADPRRDDGAVLAPPAADEIDVLLESVCAGGRGVADKDGALDRRGLRPPPHRSFGTSGLVVGRVVGRWVAPPILAFSVGIATAIWGLQTPEPSSTSFASTTPAPAVTAPMALPSLFTLRWAEVRAAIERTMIEAAVDQIARAADAEADPRTARSVVTREELQARRVDPGASLARERRAAATTPQVQTIPLDASPVIAEPLTSVAIALPPMPVPIVVDGFVARESAPPSAAPASGNREPLMTSATGAPEPIARTSAGEEEQAVWRTLTRYAAAFEQMNVGAAAAIWPSVDRRELTRAFGALKSQGVVFDACEVDVQRTTATARCSGTVSFVPKVGGSDPRVAQQAWQFTMRKSGSDWTIDDVSASRVTEASARSRERS